MISDKEGHLFGFMEDNEVAIPLTCPHARAKIRNCPESDHQVQLLEKGKGIVEELRNEARVDSEKYYYVSDVTEYSFDRRVVIIPYLTF
jgi:hypothetical protein